MTPAVEMRGADWFGPHPALLGSSGPRELCQLVTDWTGSAPAGGAIVEPKHDGIRALWLRGELVTREGSPILGAEHIEAALLRLEHATGRQWFVDGEFVVDGSFAATLRHFQARGRDGDAGILHAFDAVPLEVWEGAEPGRPLIERRPALDRLFAGAADCLRPAAWLWIEGAAEIEAHAADMIRGGAEGVVVKDPAGLYRRSRIRDWQRIKRAMTLDLEILGAVEMKARPGLLGALVLDYEGRRVRVSAGFSDDERAELWRKRRDLAGLIVEVEAMEVTEAGSLRQARYVRMRTDKEARR